VADPAICPEQRFLRAVFPDEFSEQIQTVLLKPDAEEALQELRQQIAAALRTLSYRERGILEMRYGLGDGYAYTLAESGYVFRLTRERIRQLQARSLKKLRKRAADLKNFVSAPKLPSDGVNGSRPSRD
jgi:RNA polymerase sigma factor (sigma-70 family)